MSDASFSDGWCSSDRLLPTILMVGTLRRHTHEYGELKAHTKSCERENHFLHVHYLLDESGGHVNFRHVR